MISAAVSAGGKGRTRPDLQLHWAVGWQASHCQLQAPMPEQAARRLRARLTPSNRTQTAPPVGWQPAAQKTHAWTAALPQSWAASAKLRGPCKGYSLEVYPDAHVHMCMVWSASCLTLLSAPPIPKIVNLFVRRSCPRLYAQRISDRIASACQRDSWPWKRGEPKRSSTSTMAP